MNFDAAAESYDAFMGRYSSRLAALFADFAGVAAGARVLDVGSGPGALTAELVRRVGADAVSAAEPMAHFVAAARQRNPGVEVVQASAEALPFAGDSFDATLAQLVVHFMTDPLAGIGEMTRVTRPDGVVAACVWDHAGDRSPVSPLWQAARQMDRNVDDESGLAGAREGDLGRLFRQMGLRNIEERGLVMSVEHATFDEWWQPYTQSVGPAGRYVANLTPERRAQLREICRAALSDGPVVLTFQAWAARGQPSGRT